MTIKITKKYEEINHPILKEKCPVCEKQFMIGDNLEFVPIQVSDKESFNSVTIMVHTECHFI